MITKITVQLPAINRSYVRERDDSHGHDYSVRTLHNAYKEYAEFSGIIRRYPSLMLAANDNPNISAKQLIQMFFGSEPYTVKEKPKGTFVYHIHHLYIYETL